MTENYKQEYHFKVFGFFCRVCNKFNIETNEKGYCKNCNADSEYLLPLFSKTESLQEANWRLDIIKKMKKFSSQEQLNEKVKMSDQNEKEK